MSDGCLEIIFKHPKTIFGVFGKDFGCLEIIFGHSKISDGPLEIISLGRKIFGGVRENIFLGMEISGKVRENIVLGRKRLDQPRKITHLPSKMTFRAKRVNFEVIPRTESG